METFIVSGYYEIYPPPHGIGHLEPFSFRIAATTHDEAKRTAETQLAGEVAGWVENDASVCTILVTPLERELLRRSGNMRYKFTLVETYTCEVDIPQGMSVEEHMRNEDCSCWYDSCPDDVEETWKEIQKETT